MRRPAALYDICHLLTVQLRHLPGRAGPVGGGHAAGLEWLPRSKIRICKAGPEKNLFPA